MALVFRPFVLVKHHYLIWSPAVIPSRVVHGDHPAHCYGPRPGMGLSWILRSGWALPLPKMLGAPNQTNFLINGPQCFTTHEKYGFNGAVHSNGYKRTWSVWLIGDLFVWSNRIGDYVGTTIVCAQKHQKGKVGRCLISDKISHTAIALVSWPDSSKRWADQVGMHPK